MILVIDPRSNIGSTLSDDLVAKGESVRALVRSSEGTDSLPAGVEAVTGDLAAARFSVPTPTPRRRSCATMASATAT
jgi:uncharacterized protein YbjT (DUF2867 family)